MALFNAAGLETGPSGELVSKAAVSIMGKPDWWQFQPVQEPFPGAWQRVITESPENITSTPSVYASIFRISSDVGKMRPRLMEDPDADDVWQEVRNSPLAQVLRKPNRFQTAQQFFEHWLQSKLMYGNFYALKERDARNVVIALYPLHPKCVTPLITDDGDVYYQVKADNLAPVAEDSIVPGNDIVHDRMMCLFHPLVGIAPMYAAMLTGTLGIRIQRYSINFFQNNARPSGIITVPGNLSDVQREDLKKKAEEGYSRENLGRLMVLTGGMTFNAMGVPAEQSQLAEQLKLTSEQVAQAFGVPLYKLGIGQPTLNNLAALNQHYFADTIQPHVEAIESLLTLGLNLSSYEIWLDTENLLRMDPEALMSMLDKGLGSSAMAVNEARNKLNLPRVKGGDEPLSQQQYWPLSILQEREPPKDAIAPPEPESDEDDDEDEDKAIAAALSELVVAFKQEPAWLTRNL